MITPRTRTLLVLPLYLLAFALSLPGCGSDTSGSATPEQTTLTDEAKAQQEANEKYFQQQQHKKR